MTVSASVTPGPSIPTREEREALLAALDDPSRFVGVMLFGSGARGALSRYSDLDLVLYSREHLADPEKAYRLSYREERLISRSVVLLEEAEAALHSADTAIFAVQGLRDA